MSKNLVETVCPQSEKREEWIRDDDTKEKRRQFLPNLPKYFRQEETCKRQGGEDRARVREGKKRNRRLVGAANKSVTSKELAEWCRLQQKNLNLLNLPKRKGGLSATK